MQFTGRGVLVDVEGTTSAVAYVYDVMFPFARRGIEAYVTAHWADESFAAVREQFAADAGHELASPAELVAEAERLMDGDVKATGLKQLQGLVWEAGFRSGELQAHVFADVPPALAAWREAGVDVRVYSSGSIHAQRLFFGHTEAGDLSPSFSGHYDTTTGPKREAPSYTAIAADWSLAPSEILFLSDVTEELEAARAAGMQTALVNRPGNAEPTTVDPPHTAIESFAEIDLETVGEPST
ncbi:Enolase-phosphatase E1 [Botrimarina colliarenosi]|uniref:Enolase-phosphatase E1 n=1 Tax=Botrimarina colliarenosi TaxID=2528001 RepID=A0A5C6ACG1_9BACT|nr:acireductone synthase [Botrimarina colliarenosi]TWT96835.1 Enolase-phosphatase E1 [Botrimarina colliarenosi]